MLQSGMLGHTGIYRRYIGAVRSAGGGAGQWRHDAGSHSTDHSRRVRLWAVR